MSTSRTRGTESKSWKHSNSPSAKASLRQEAKAGTSARQSSPINFDGSEELNEGDPAKELQAEEATKYRAVSARLNYLCQGRLDIAYACKEAARKLSEPQHGDWVMLKRIACYLRAHPRLRQRFVWQKSSEMIDAYVDSDWAWCRRTGRSTSGGALIIGQHCIKGYSNT